MSFYSFPRKSVKSVLSPYFVWRAEANRRPLLGCGAARGVGRGVLTAPRRAVDSPSYLCRRASRSGGCGSSFVAT